MGQMMGTAGSPGMMGPMPGVEGPRPSPGFMGPMPEVEGARPGAVAPSGIIGGVAGGLKKLTDFASFLGDTPEEREKNAKAFSALVKDVGNTVSDMSESTLMQRMMKEQMGGPQYISEGQSPAGGVGAIPRTFDPATAGRIMSQLGFK